MRVCQPPECGQNPCSHGPEGKKTPRCNDKYKNKPIPSANTSRTPSPGSHTQSLKLNRRKLCWSFYLTTVVLQTLRAIRLKTLQKSYLSFIICCTLLIIHKSRTDCNIFYCWNNKSVILNLNKEGKKYLYNVNVPNKLYYIGRSSLQIRLNFHTFILFVYLQLFIWM